MNPVLVVVTAAALVAGAVAPVAAADDAKVKAATRRVERGGKMIGSGKVGDGVVETAKGVGDTVVEGAKYSGNQLKASGKSAERPAKSAWKSFTDGAGAFGASVKRFFSRLFS
jgi:hypothetical protein